MSRVLDAESNGSIFIEIGCGSERNILTCKVVGRKPNIYYNATRSDLSSRYTIYIFSKKTPALLVF